MRDQAGVKIVLLSRQFLPVYNPNDTSPEGIVVEMSLTGLDEASSIELLEQRNVEPGKFKRIFELTKGHPLFLELVNPSETLDNLSLHSDIKKYIHSEIFMKLPEEERKLLGIASVFRYPIQSSVFFTESDISYETIDRLVEKRLLNEFTGGYMVHDLVREFFYQRLTPKLRNMYHKAAAEHYIIDFEKLSVTAELERETAEAPKDPSGATAVTEKPSPDVLETKMEKKFDKIRRAYQFCLEAQFHYIQSEEFDEAVRLVIDEGVKLISYGFLDEFLINLSKFPESKVDQSKWTTIQILIGDILTIQGEWDSALSHYNTALNICIAEGFHLRAAEAYRNIGGINFRRGEPKKAVNFLKRALEISEAESDNHGIANVHYWLGVIMNRQGEYDKAIEHFNTCMQFAEKINFLPGIAKTYTGISDVLVNKGEYENAIKNYLKSIDILDQTGDIYEKSEVYNRIGITYCKQGGHEDDAIKYYTKRIGISKNIGDIRGEGYGLSNAAECYASKGNLDTALEFCKKALVIFEKMNEKRMIANTLMVYGIIYGHKKDWKTSLGYFGESVSIAKDIDSLDMQAQIYFNYGFMLRDMGQALKSMPEGSSFTAASATVDDSKFDDPSSDFRQPKKAEDAFSMARENLQKSIDLYKGLKNDVKVRRLSDELAMIPES
jgi:tetratricopeptide (TPR) repeat protein